MAHRPSASCDRRTFALTRSGANIDLHNFGCAHDEWHIDWAVMGQHAPARADDRGGLRPWRRTDFPPDDDAWMDMYDPRDPAIEGFQGG
jgi:hypothetical protein